MTYLCVFWNIQTRVKSEPPQKKKYIVISNNDLVRHQATSGNLDLKIKVHLEYTQQLFTCSYITTLKHANRACSVAFIAVITILKRFIVWIWLSSWFVHCFCTSFVKTNSTSLWREWSYGKNMIAYSVYEKCRFMILYVNNEGKFNILWKDWESFWYWWS